jgi:hypothetical protein
MDKWILVESSNINKINFDLTTLTLSINFKPNSTYEYLNVPYWIWEGLIGSPSKGKYFHSFIKGKYETKKVEL